MLLNPPSNKRGFKKEGLLPVFLNNPNGELENANRFDKYRRLRNDIAYRGDVATEREADEIRTLFKVLLEDLEPAFETRSL